MDTLREAIFEASIGAVADRLGRSLIDFGPSPALQRYHGRGYRCYAGALSTGEVVFLAAAIDPTAHSVFRITDEGHSYVTDLSFRDGEVRGEAMDRALPDSPRTGNREIASMLGRLREEALEAMGLPFEFNGGRTEYAEAASAQAGFDPAARR